MTLKNLSLNFAGLSIALLSLRCSDILQSSLISCRQSVAARLKYNSLVNEGRYSDRIRRLAARILMNSLSNLVFQWRKFLREDKEKTKERGRERGKEGGLQAAAVETTESTGGDGGVNRNRKWLRGGCYCCWRSSPPTPRLFLISLG